MKQSKQKSLFDDAVARNRGRYVGIARAYAGEDSDDLLQEILMQIWGSLPGFQQRSSVDTWCYRVALNTALSWRRNERNKSESSADSDKIADVSGAIDGHDSVTLLERFLSSLSHADRAMVLMYLDDLSGKEIAEVTGLSEGAVRVRIHRIKGRLESWSATDS